MLYIKKKKKKKKEIKGIKCNNFINNFWKYILLLYTFFFFFKYLINIIQLNIILF